VSEFLSKLWLEQVDGDKWIVAAPLRYRSDLLRGIVVVPTGYETDLASVPRGFWNIIPKSGKYNPAAALHDGGYTGHLRTDDGQHMRLIKKLSDQLFLEAMLVLGVTKEQLIHR
jgi:hypothetical protein